MSGHNKWAQIKHKKAATDKAKSAIWGKLARRITVESKLSGGDINSPTLRTMIEKARKENMPKENIERAVTKGVSNDSAAMEPILYETYGPGGAAILIQALSDNRNRTAQEIKHILSKNSLSLASPGSAAWAFQKTSEGYTPNSTIKLSELESENLIKILDELDNNDDVDEVYTNAE